MVNKKKNAAEASKGKKELQCQSVKMRALAGAGYLCFLLPLIYGEKEPFVRFHCNQALINFAMSTVVAVLLSMIPFAGAFLVILQERIFLLLCIRGIIQAAEGKTGEIPLVGRVRIISTEC